MPFTIDAVLNPWIPKPPWKRLPYGVAWFLGYRTGPQSPVGMFSTLFWCFIGIFCSLTIIGAVTQAIEPLHAAGAPIMVGSFGAAAVLEFHAIESPLAQPRNAILGQLVSSLVGVSINRLLDLSPVHPLSASTRYIGGGLSCAVATIAMALTGTTHPPGAATALLAVVDDGVAGLGWLLVPGMLLGSLLMLAVALLINNLRRQFPVYWWTKGEVGTKWQPKPDPGKKPDVPDLTTRLKMIDEKTMAEGKAKLENEPYLCDIEMGRVGMARTGKARDEEVGVSGNEQDDKVMELAVVKRGMEHGPTKTRPPELSIMPRRLAIPNCLILTPHEQRVIENLQRRLR